MKDVFISHATEDQTTAAEVCALLEARGIACWIAPRDRCMMANPARRSS